MKCTCKTCNGRGYVPCEDCDGDGAVKYDFTKICDPRLEKLQSAARYVDRQLNGLLEIWPSKRAALFEQAEKLMEDLEKEAKAILES